MQPKLFAALGLLLSCTQARADNAVSQADRAEIDRVITAQIDAFRHDDAAAAFALAAPGIQRKFGDGAHFLAAVQQAYPQVYRPRSFRFGALSGDGPVTQTVSIIGPDGVAATAVYDMEHEADGSWRISGCSLQRSLLRDA